MHCAFILIHFFYLFIYVLLILCDIYCAKLKQTTMQLVLELIKLYKYSLSLRISGFCKSFLQVQVRSKVQGTVMSL